MQNDDPPLDREHIDRPRNSVFSAQPHLLQLVTQRFDVGLAHALRSDRDHEFNNMRKLGADIQRQSCDLSLNDCVQNLDPPSIPGGMLYRINAIIATKDRRQDSISRNGYVPLS